MSFDCVSVTASIYYYLRFIERFFDLILLGHLILLEDVVQYAQKAIVVVEEMLAERGGAPVSSASLKKACISMFQGVWRGCSLEQHDPDAIG